MLSFINFRRAIAPSLIYEYVITCEGVSCIDKNQKTLKSVDFSTSCPKRDDGKECPYCYVKAARDKNFNAKKVEERTYNGELLRFKKPEIEKLNSLGGLRLFSFGDYKPGHDADITAFLNDAEKIGLKVKAITKQPDFIKKYHDHPAINVIHVSTDNFGGRYGVDLDLAKELKQAFPKVRIRSVIMNKDDEEKFLNDPDIDVHTFNHATYKDKSGFEGKPQIKYSKKAISDFADKHPGKVCCAPGEDPKLSGCMACKTKCAAGDPNCGKDEEEDEEI